MTLNREEYISGKGGGGEKWAVGGWGGRRLGVGGIWKLNNWKGKGGGFSCYN